MKLAGLLPQFKNLVSLDLNLNNCCAEAVNKLVSSITHKTLEKLGLCGIKLTPVTAAALGRSISEMSSLRMLSISGPRRGFLETGFDRTSLVSQLFTFNTGGCRFLPSLHELFLERLNLNERGLRELLDNLKFFSELTLLSLYGNPLGDAHTVHSMHADTWTGSENSALNDELRQNSTTGKPEPTKICITPYLWLLSTVCSGTQQFMTLNDSHSDVLQALDSE
ncbi:hypothetical protein pdam_00011668 [Pocillopora damicornis]|uniref:Uncharacterized protein n=1 Tax=Pocillopora damicornis TaxID=46731 RepID=A0A3M6URM9_POCDA|nr:hypothetical protein pdam_00011668 [Pocillopora damicornis]